MERKVDIKKQKLGREKNKIVGKGNMFCIKGALALFVLVSGYVCQIKLNTLLSSPR